MYIFYDLLSVDFCYGVISAVTVYSNAGEQEKLIKKESKGLSGIYRWTNLITGDSYIGGAINFTSRLNYYFNENSLGRTLRRSNSRIVRSLLKYGHSSFSFEILEYCEPMGVIKREQYYIDLLEPEYNICQTAGSMLGFRHTEESKAKTAAAQLGKKLTDEHKANISEGMKSRVLTSTVKNKIICTEETRAKMSITRQGFSADKRLEIARKLALAARRAGGSGAGPTILEVTNNKTGETVEYVSVRGAAREMGISRSTILKYIKLGKVYKQIYSFNLRSSA